MWPAITSPRWTDAWVQGEVNVYIPVNNYTSTEGSTAGTVSYPNDSTGMRPASRNRAGDWSAMSGVASSRLTFTRSGGHAISNFIGVEDELEANWPVLEEWRNRQAYELGRQVNNSILTAIRGYPNNSVQLGTTSNRINPNGTWNNNNARALPHDAIDQWSLLIQERDLNESLSEGLGPAYAIMHPRIFRVLRADMLARDYHWDELTGNALREGGVLSSVGWQGRLYGVNIYVSNDWPIAVAHATARASDVDWYITCGMSTAVAANVRPPIAQYFTPAENQITDQPGYVFRQAVDYGVLELDGANRMQTYRIYCSNNS